MLTIVQMSDFHFGAGEYSPEQEEAILGAMVEKIRETGLKKKDELFLCLCGDYIDSSPKSGAIPVEDRFKRAKEVLEEKLLKPLRRLCTVRLGLCAGNHDITHGLELEAFSRYFLSRSIAESYAIHCDAENVDLVFINSADPADYRRGFIDYPRLEALLKTLPPDSTKYFFLHHTILSMDENDGSSIRNAPALIRLVDQYSVKALFHGHTHGQYAIQIGREGCPVIGVGAALARNYPNVNSQFNLIVCNQGVLLSADTYEYHADRAMMPGVDPFSREPVFLSSDNSLFCGQRFSQLYQQVNREARARGTLYHMCLRVSSDYESFEADVNSSFGTQKELDIMGKQFSYKELAEMWEAPNPDKDTLFFNHGQYFVSNKVSSGLDYLIRELTAKKTSSRAILSTVNTVQIAGTPPDDLLPSMMSLQYSFDEGQTTLYVTMNLRALELSRFLKINACEILYLAGEIRKKLPFRDIDVTIHAFRAQCKEQFGCFLRAGLDTDETVNSLPVWLAAFPYSSQKKKIRETVEKLIALIEDKRNRTETVIETCGIEGLLKAIDVVLPQINKKKSYREGLLKIRDKTAELLENLNQQKRIREKSSVPTRDLKRLETALPILYDELIKLFKELVAS